MYGLAYVVGLLSQKGIFDFAREWRINKFIDKNYQTSDPYSCKGAISEDQTIPVECT